MGAWGGGGGSRGGGRGGTGAKLGLGSRSELVLGGCTAGTGLPR